MRRLVPVSVILLTFAFSLYGSSARAADDTRIVEAAKRQEWQAVRRLIRQRADVNGVDGEGATALLWATYWSHADSVRALLTAKADARKANRLGISPLLQASRLGDSVLIALLLEAGADPEGRHPDGETPLMAAAGAGTAGGVRLLLKAGADVNAKENGQGETALMWAAAEGHADVVDALIDAGATLDVVGKPSSLIHHAGGFAGGRGFTDHVSQGLTAVMMSAREGHVDVTRRLAEAGADLSHTNPDGFTALSIATINSHFDLAAMLLEEGADADDGALYEAVEMHNLAPVVTTGDATRPRPYHQNRLTALDLVRLLLEYGANPNNVFVGELHFGAPTRAATTNQSPLVRAAQSSDVAAIRLMVAHGADVNRPDRVVLAPPGGFEAGPPVPGPNAGLTPLMIAMGGGGGGGRGFGGGGRGGGVPQFRESSERNLGAAVTAMLESPTVDVNATTPTGDTAMHRMAQAGNVQMIQVLADHGARLDVKNAAGFTPLDLAMGKGAPPRAQGPQGLQGPPGRGAQPPAGPQPQAIALLQKLMGVSQ